MRLPVTARPSIQPLTTDLVDDICLALQSGELHAGDVPPCRASSLGAYVELDHFVRGMASPKFQNDWLDPGSLQRFSERKEASWLTPSPSFRAFAQIDAVQRDANLWTHLTIQMKRAAVGVGFSHDHSGKFVAALEELWNNVIEHSGASDSGYIACAADTGKFEFVVADHGLGVLHSLRTNPAFSSLVDSGHALELALSEGVSRHGSTSARGYGFRPLFVGLAQIVREMRFRSGDHARIVTRRGTEAPSSRTTQLASLTGFFCSVLCEL